MIHRIRYLLLALFSAVLPCAAQSVYVYPATVIAPRGSYQTVSAIVTGVNNKGGTWTTNHGMLVGTNPCTANEICTISVYDATAETATVTFTSTVGAVTGTSTDTFTVSPTPVTTWPRMLFTQANLASMQAKATGGNVMYQVWLSLGISRYNTDNATTAWGRTGSTGWSCQGGNGQPSTAQVYTNQEFAMNYFAFMALVDPSDATYNWKCYAHDVLLYVTANYPTAWGLTYDFKDNAQNWIAADWLRGAPGLTLTSGELTTIRNGYQWLVQDAIAGSGGYPNPTNTYNSTGMMWGGVGQGTPYPQGNTDLDNMRAMGGNNYNLARMLVFTYAGLLFNDTSGDAPNFATGAQNTCGATRYQMCVDGTAGSMIAYWNYLDGALLYTYWPHIEDPNVSRQAYNAYYSNLATMPQCEWYDGNSYPCFGEGRNGGSSEGEWYQYSLLMPRLVQNILHTAGMDDPLLYGPQISAATSSWWDLKLVHDLETLTYPTNYVFNPTFGQPLTYPNYGFLAVGDTNTYERQPSDVNTDTEMLTYDTMVGRTDRTNAIEWITYNTARGGPLGTLYNCAATGNCGFNSNMQFGGGGSSVLDLFLSLGAVDPVAGTLPTDPRPSLPTDIYDASFNQQTIMRTGWGSTNTLVAWWMNNSGINHEYNMDGRHDILYCTSGTCDYVTKGRVIFNDYNVRILAGYNENQLGIYNSLNSNPVYGFNVINSYGAGQWPQGGSLSFISSTHSELPTYAAVIGNMTNAYNGTMSNGYFAPAQDVLSASRSMIWLKGGNQFVYYDRDTVGHSASTQYVGEVATGTPTISGSTASWLTQSAAHKVYYTNLLPSGATISNIGLPCPGTPNTNCDPGNQSWDWEPTAVLETDPPGTPTASQFLTALEWGASGFSKTTTTLVQSTSGQAFDGASVGTSCIMFERAWPVVVTGTSYPASGCTTHYVSDLTPSTLYAVTGAGAPTSATTDTAGVLVFSATGTGSIVIGALNPVANAPTFSPVAGTYSGTQNVVVSSTSAGALVCYNTSGASIVINGGSSCPGGSTQYTAPVVVASSGILYAVAGGASYSDSSQVSAAYTIIPPPTYSILRQGGQSFSGVTK